MGNCFSGAADPSAGGGKRVTAASRGLSSASSSSSKSPPPFDDFLVLKVDASSPPPPPLTDVFALGRVLGRGAFGVTRLAKERATGESVAVKTIARRRIVAAAGAGDGGSATGGAECVRCEVEAMRRVAGHPHIVSLKSCHEDEKGVHLAMELCSGGELFDQVSKRGAYTEACAASLVRELARVVAHCHARGVVHRDLKPENLLLASPRPDAALKAIDFGLAALVEPCGEPASLRDGGQEGSASGPLSSSPPKKEPPLTELCGSPLYVAPEVLRRSYGREADLWSVGVIAHVLLTGRAPFEAPTEGELFDRILAHKRLDLRPEPWPQLSPGAKDFVSRLLERDPRRRLTARQALEHPWLQDKGAAAKEMECAKQLDVLKTMCNFAAAGAVRKRAAAVVAESAPPELIEALLPAFTKIDAADAGDGTVALGALPRLLGCVDAGMAALRGGSGEGGLEASAAAIAAAAAAGDAAAEAAIAAAASPCAKAAAAAAAPAPSPSPSPPSGPSATAKAILKVFQEVMGHDGTQCGCRVDYVALLRSAAAEARALREETLAASLAKLDPKRTGELPRSRLEAAAKRHCGAIPQHVIDRAVEAAAAAEAAAGSCCAPRKMAAARKKKVEEEAGENVAAAAAAEAKKPVAEKGHREESKQEEEMVDYELFCAALAKVCPSCPKAAKAA